MKITTSILCLFFAATAWSQNTRTVTPTTDTAAGGNTPSQACKQLIEAAKADNYESVAKMTVPMPQKVGKKKSQERFDRMHRNYMADIRNMTCETEQVAGDRAVVTAATKDDKRLIPFVQSEGQWKFDVRTYRSFYNTGHKKDAKSKSM